LYLEIHDGIARTFVRLVREHFGLEVAAPAVDIPPQPELGDLSIAAAFELAKMLRRPPRQIAEQIARDFLPVSGIERVTVAGGGYVNFHFDRSALATEIFRRRAAPMPSQSGEAVGQPRPRKVLVEHTSINPNKAAHIGHLRNAVLGDTFARLLRFRGYPVEIQNYIDNTGVQVADVVVGFMHLENKSSDDVRALASDPAVRFDYLCWNLYARVSRYYEENGSALAWRAETLKAIEEDRGQAAEMARVVSSAIVALHLSTMDRINVRYDLLVEESEILRLDFWKAAFEEMKRVGAIRYEAEGKNAGCWVMSIVGPADYGESSDEHPEDVKIIVRSNGTVTYVGKDIAYHLWKFALLGRDFAYAPFYRYSGGKIVWATCKEPAPGAPAFGHAGVAYAVIDARQAYLQNVVAAALRAMGFDGQAAHLHHFAYEVVGLTPACARELGYELSAEDMERGFLEVSGRKGLGMKADDLIDRLIEKATQEVASREMTHNPGEQAAYGRIIAVGALRYFLSKFSRRVTIAFDFKEALAFEGETGPYLQYSTVRARNILRKFSETHPEFDPSVIRNEISDGELKGAFEGKDGSAFWQLVALAAQLELAAEQAISNTEPAALAKYAFRLAQSFNNFYHRYHILSEPHAARQKFLLFLVHIVSQTLARTLDVLGIEVPEKM
jgi:arginyl-tRNA synthetase